MSLRLEAVRPSVVSLVIVAIAMPHAVAPAWAQDVAALCGRVFDATGAALPAASVSMRHPNGAIVGATQTGTDGRYCIADLAAGVYRVIVSAPGFRDEIITAVAIDAHRMTLRDVWIATIESRERIEVRADLLDRSALAPHHVVDDRTVDEIPLNGRHLVDVTLLAPGAVTPSQTGFSSRASRGVGPVALNIAGNREEAVAFVVNGVSVNNLTFGSLIYEPPLSSVREVRVDTATFGAEHGHVSGAIVQVVTRSGTDRFGGEAYEFLRHDALDARNYFAPPSPDSPTLERNQFGGFIGGPIRRRRSHFFAAYEGVRHYQAVHLNSLVLSDAERSAASDPVVQRLIPLIPRANVVDGRGTPRYVGSAPAVVNTDRWTIDLRHAMGDRDRLHAFWGSQRLQAREPAAQGNSIPGFGSTRRPSHGILTISHTHTVSPTVVNEARLGRSRLHGGTFPAAPLNPADFGIRNGVTSAIGLPQISVAGDLNFGGPGILPQGRFDTSWVFVDSTSVMRGAHAMTFGGEYRHFINENYFEGAGTFAFPTVAAFLAGRANAFNVTLGQRWNVIDQRALALFFQDRVRPRPGLTLDVGLRYEWHVTPTERGDKFVVFDAATASLLRIGVDRPDIYRQNNRNFEPRLGAAWNLSSSGRTVLHAAYARTADQPGTTAVRDTAGNPPFALPLTASGSIDLANAIDSAVESGLAPMTIDPDFRNATLQAWNVRVHHELTAGWVANAAYLASAGANLRISRNLNQPVNGVRPFARVADSSPILPGRRLGNITQVESSGFSRYRAASLAIAKRPWYGLQVDASYTWSKSLDTNSLNSSGFAVQDSYNIAGELGPSDFDARHRVVVKATYDMPFSRNVLVRDWHVAVVVQSQSGNPVNIVTSNSSINGVPNTIRPDLIAPIRIIGSVDQWFDTSAFVPAALFGNVGRNAVTGPAFHNTDLSVRKHVRLAGRTAIELRVEVFNVFNQVNFGPPGNVVGTPAFGKITRTRFAGGEGGSARQVQLAGKVTF